MRSVFMISAAFALSACATSGGAVASAAAAVSTAGKGVATAAELYCASTTPGERKAVRAAITGGKQVIYCEDGSTPVAAR